MHAKLQKKQLEDMLDAAQIVSETMRVLQKSQSNIVGEILKTSDSFLEWDHLPKDDVYDQYSHSQYYYHTHSKSLDGKGIHDDEHGHFHTFIRGKAFPKEITPLNLPDYNQNIPISDINTHIIGIGMNAEGSPIRLFTVNRWVTGETWFDAQNVVKAIDHYEIDDTRPSWAVNLWITAMIKLFKPQITRLIQQRDQTMKQWQELKPFDNIYENRELEVTSHLDINLGKHIDEIEKAMM